MLEKLHDEANQQRSSPFSDFHVSLRTSHCYSSLESQWIKSCPDLSYFGNQQKRLSASCKHSGRTGSHDNSNDGSRSTQGCTVTSDHFANKASVVRYLLSFQLLFHRPTFEYLVACFTPLRFIPCNLFPHSGSAPRNAQQ